MSNREQPTSTSAKILYRPVGLVSSLVAGAIAGRVFDSMWRRASPGEKSDPPGPLETEYPLTQILVAAAVQGAVFSVVRTVVSRGGARVFERATGEWPGS